MNFGKAIEALKEGSKVQRAGWNGKGMHLWLWTPRDDPNHDHETVGMEPCIVMFTAQGQHQPGWLASQPDMLADDWSTVQ